MLRRSDLISVTNKRGKRVYRVLILKREGNICYVDYLGLKLDIDVTDTLETNTLSGKYTELDVLEVDNEERTAVVEIVDGTGKQKRVDVKMGIKIKYNGELLDANVIETSKSEMIITCDKVLEVGNKLAGVIKYDGRNIKFRATIERVNTKKKKKYAIKYSLLDANDYYSIEDIFNNYLKGDLQKDNKLRR